MRILVCDKCGERIDDDVPLNDRSWVQAAVALDETVRDGGHPKDYHRECARTVTLADLWQRPGLVEL